MQILQWATKNGADNSFMGKFSQGKFGKRTIRSQENSFRQLGKGKLGQAVSMVPIITMNYITMTTGTVPVLGMFFYTTTSFLLFRGLSLFIS